MCVCHEFKDEFNYICNKINHNAGRTGRTFISYSLLVGVKTLNVHSVCTCNKKI